MRSNNMWRRFFAMAAAVVFAVAAMVPAAAMADVVDDLASTSPVHEKTLKDNGDGTYDLTLSVSGDAEQTDKVKPVDIVLVVDASTSMNWKIDGIGSKTRMQAAHDAAAALAEELLTAENANLPADQQTRISVVTFGVKAELAQGYSTNAEDISKAVPTKAKYFEGTNWEAALILANEQLANKQLGARENAEKHVIFLSDGDPTLRMSAEGFGESGIEWNLFDGKNLDGTYGTRVDDPNGRNLSAATRVAKGRPASSMYVVNTSKSAKEMGTFAEKTGGSLLDGTTENNLAAAFSQIGQVVRKSVSYQDVALTDQLSSWVEFVSADDGSVGNIRYTKNGNDWTDADVPAAKIDGDTLTWNLGKIDKGTTYSVTFTIRPNAQAKADVASKGVDTGYATNNADTSGVAYKTVMKTLEGDKVSGLQKSPFKEKPVITLTAPAAATATLSGSKTLEGRTLKDDEFKFRISVAEGSKENTPLPDETSVTNTADGSITFGTITFSKTGTYLYDVVEDTSVLPEGVSAVTRDPQRVEVKVTLGDDGALKAETVGELKFVNTYSAKPTSVSFKATKVLKGAQLTDGAFTFELLNNDEVMDSVTNDAEGNIAFKELTLDKAGTYTFKIVEVAGDKKGMTYDATEHTVTVRVDDNGQGQLVVAAIEGDNPTFTNTYVEPTAKPESTDKSGASGAPSNAQIPKMGDANMALPTVLCLIAVACIGVGVIVRRKNK
ncbi:Spy0128 family protein [Collinsella bouchesdurhonensis]|uniref:Spy0128 family protein n=1 Tax=Collinsella bouchesdurhonensis TaxID=1907654 RepID=UPI00058DAEC5|nr:FctA domain-containing protein [Collinsella bouchesdurhonensis]